MSQKNRLKLKQSREKFKTEKKHGQSRSIGGRGSQRTEYWNAKTRKWQRTKPAPLPRKVEVEKTKPETRQERIKREGLATWRVNSDAQKKLNIDKKRVKVDPPKTTNKTTSTTERKKIPGEFPGSREEFDKKYGTGSKKIPGEFPGTREEFNKKYGIEDKGDKKESNNNKVKIKQEDSKPKEVNQKVKINKTEKKNPFRPGMSERQIKSQIRVLKRRNKASDRLKIKRLQKKLAAF